MELIPIQQYHKFEIREGQVEHALKRLFATKGVKKITIQPSPPRPGFACEFFVELQSEMSGDRYEFFEDVAEQLVANDVAVEYAPFCVD